MHPLEACLPLTMQDVADVAHALNALGVQALVTVNDLESEISVMSGDSICTLQLDLLNQFHVHCFHVTANREDGWRELELIHCFARVEHFYDAIEHIHQFLSGDKA
jgi:hypothetical protein